MVKSQTAFVTIYIFYVVIVEFVATLNSVETALFKNGFIFTLYGQIEMSMCFNVTFK